MSAQAKVPLFRLLPEELEPLMAEFGQPRYRADQVLRAAWHDSPASFEDIRQLPAGLRTRLADRFSLDAAIEVRRAVSDDGGTTKLLLRMSEGTLIETVRARRSPSALHRVRFDPGGLRDGLRVLRHRPNGL